MKAKSSGAHAIRILAPEGYKQKEATATRFCLPAAHHLQSEIGSHTSSAHSTTSSVVPTSCERTSRS